MDFDNTKDVYLFLHGKTDLNEKAQNALVSNGFLKEKIILAIPSKVGQIGDYMALLWKPSKPDQIKIQQITKVDEDIEPMDLIGHWSGVSKDDLFTIPL